LNIEMRLLAPQTPFGKDDRRVSLVVSGAALKSGCRRLQGTHASKSASLPRRNDRILRSLWQLDILEQVESVPTAYVGCEKALSQTIAAALTEDWILEPRVTQLPVEESFTVICSQARQGCRW
jgi:hypothetical protein